MDARFWVHPFGAPLPQTENIRPGLNKSRSLKRQIGATVSIKSLVSARQGRAFGDRAEGFNPISRTRFRLPFSAGSVSRNALSFSKSDKRGANYYS